MSYDYKTRSWEHDIHAFMRWKEFLSSISSEEVRQRVRGHMLDIQKRWPQYIKKNEIP